MAEQPIPRIDKFVWKKIQHCSMCLNDPEVACPRNVDVECLECGKRLCAKHMIEHLTKEHFISIEWRGFLKK